MPQEVAPQAHHVASLVHHAAGRHRMELWTEVAVYYTGPVDMVAGRTPHCQAQAHTVQADRPAACKGGNSAGTARQSGCQCNHDPFMALINKEVLSESELYPCVACC
jgi:hypothetical protein